MVSEKYNYIFVNRFFKNNYVSGKKKFFRRSINFFFLNKVYLVIRKNLELKKTTFC